MKKIFFLLVMCLAALTMQAQTKPQYVDLGLPSGILWKTTNEKGYHDWNSAKKKFGDKLPTEKQWVELKKNCKWTWTGKGYRVTGKNGKSIFLPAAGRADVSYGPDEVPSGEYWSSDESDEILLVRSLHLSDVEMGDNWYNDSLSIRLVRDTCYVDLGLPSGTKWKRTNEKSDLYDWDSAKKKYGDILPTKEQWKELRDSCTWSWTGKGYRVTGKNGNSIVLPAAGCRNCDGSLEPASTYGSYWSSTSDGLEYGYFLYFSSNKVSTIYNNRCGSRSIRLVKD